MSLARLIRDPKVFLFGDSITQFSFSEGGCWGSVIADRLQRKCDVINRGFSGYNTRWNKIILPRLVTKETADDIVAFTIFLGANDSNNKQGIQHVPIDEFKKNLLDMIEYLVSIGISKEKIIIIGPPPCNEVQWFKECDTKEPPAPHTKCNELAKDYAAHVVEAAVDKGVPCVDLFNIMSREKDWQRFLSDGLHFSREGSEFFAEQLWPFIDNLTKDLPVILPLWSDVDANSPESCLSE